MGADLPAHPVHMGTALKPSVIWIIEGFIKDFHLSSTLSPGNDIDQSL